MKKLTKIFSKPFLILFFILITGSLIIFLSLQLSGTTKIIKKEPIQTSIANPASQYCIEQGGIVDIRKKPDKSEYGVCVFEDNRQCEEWALLRKECQKGGVKITGYTTNATIYCAITGNIATEGTPENPEATCTVNGLVCPADNFYKTNFCSMNLSQ